MQEVQSEGQLVVRQMTCDECGAVAEILQFYATQEILLWRTAEDIRDHVDNFFVAEKDGKVVGCIALQDYGEGLYELRSLAVRDGYAGSGVGSALVLGIVNEARRRKGRELFALTRKVNFFLRNGFEIEKMDSFPQKVWKDCQLCRKRDCCDETAVAVRF